MARRRRPDLEIVVFEKGAFTSYAACGIPSYASGQIETAESLVARTPEAFRKANIDVRTRSEVVAIDLAARRVQALDLVRGGETWESFDNLLLATGALPIVPRVEGIESYGSLVALFLQRRAAGWLEQRDGRTGPDPAAMWWTRHVAARATP